MPDKPVSLDDALNNGKLNATFLYATAAPTLTPGLSDFIAAVDPVVEGTFAQRAIIFLTTVDPKVISAATCPLIQLSEAAPAPTKPLKGITVKLTAPAINPGLSLSVSTAATLSLSEDGNSILFTPTSNTPTVTFPELASVTFQQDNSATLSFAGPNQGTFAFSLAILRSALKDTLNWGFQVLVPNHDSSHPTIANLAAYFPLAGYDGNTGPDQIGFNCQINALNPTNQVANASMSKLYFTGITVGSEQTTTLASFYRSNTGLPIRLVPNTATSNGQLPAGLVITNGYQPTTLTSGFTMAPDGDFVLTADGSTANTHIAMLGGLSGTETITIRPAASGYAGYRLRFTSLQPANVPVFPLVSYSPVSAPIDPKAKLLDDAFVTSWASILPPPSDSGTGFYAAAPKGADLFGISASSSSTPSGTLVPTVTGMSLPAAIVLPLIPFAGLQAGTGERDLTTNQVADLERQILSATRRGQISFSMQKTAVTAHAALGLKSAAGVAQDCPFNATTPAGFISIVGCDGAWKQLLLAQVMSPPPPPPTPPPPPKVALQMGFTGLQPELQSAFQTNNLFLVAANAQYLGTPSSGTFMPPAQVTVDNQNLFFNSISIGQWTFRAGVGQANQYADYRNVMIVKGVKGKLIDLVVSPDKWTMRTEFAAPTTKDSPQPDITQLIPLSAWISTYFSNALERLDNEKDQPYFQKFCDIIQSEDWTGVLLLRVDIEGIPSDLAGIAAGVDDPTRFYAHHIGIDISQIDGATVQQKNGSSIFGLVYYVDLSYDDSQGPHAIAPKDPTAQYEFTLLTLKALFLNSALQKFDSLAQVVLNDIFGAAVKAMGDGGNIYNAILLQGAFQKHGSAGVYSLSSSGTNTYLLANNVLTSVEIESAVMSTRDDGAVSGTVVSWIAMGGYMNFALIKDLSGATVPLPDADFFSFGSPDGTPAPQQGLNFNNLGLQISFPRPKQGALTHGAPMHTMRLRDDDKPAPVMVESEISFNVASSTVRAQGLFKNFQMELLGLQSGADKTTPESLGYLAVANDYGLPGPGSNAWHGLRCNLNMGTPGELAGKINLTSTMLLSWADSKDGDSTYEAGIGLLLPGASSGGEIFSLQSIIKLSIGVVQLFYNASAQSFLLLMNEIALKFFGLLKIPPNGATAFFLFGNPNGNSPTGLGWFAIYNQEQKSGNALPQLSSAGPGELAAPKREA